MDKRSDKRINFNVEGSVAYNGNTCSGDIENLSMKGIFLRGCADIPAGADVLVTIHLSGASSDLIVHVSGKVARKEPQGIAVSFDRIDLDSYTHLKNIISYNMTEEW